MRRRLTRREKRKRSKQLVMIISICLLLVIGVGYAAFSTTLTLKAKGNIKCGGTLAKDLLLKEVVTNGDGLYKDEYEQGKYFYRGINSNNYITFNNETWRILSLEDDDTLKIIKNESVGTNIFDSKTEDNWTRPAELNTYLNSEYLNTISENYDKIINHDFSVGAVEYYNSNLNQQIEDEKKTLWNGKVGLITASEYIKANTNKEQCGNYSLITDNYSCRTTNWIYISIVPHNDNMWTMTRVIRGNNSIKEIIIFGTDGSFATFVKNDMPAVVVPVLYLSKDTKLCGNGTEENQYTIAN